MPATGKTRLREAAEWFAVMHGDDAARSRGAFETWLAASERNREAYSHIAETFSLGKNLRPAEVAAPAASRSPERARRLRLAAAVLGVAAVGGALLHLASPILPTRRAVADAAPLATAKGEIRSLRLADGSLVTLDTDSRLRVAYTATGRDLWLDRGRARFDVAHDGRTFTVHAGGGAVVARGTLFDVRLDAQGAGVNLLRGAIDVVAPRAGSAPAMVRRLRPGEAMAFSGTASVVDPAPADTTALVQRSWPQSLLELDDATVGELIAEANRYSERPLQLADAALASRRISGTFRVNDADRLARRLGSLLDVPVSHTADGRILLGGTSL